MIPSQCLRSRVTYSSCVGIIAPILSRSTSRLPFPIRQPCRRYNFRQISPAYLILASSTHQTTRLPQLESRRFTSLGRRQAPITCDYSNRGPSLCSRGFSPHLSASKITNLPTRGCTTSNQSSFASQASVLAAARGKGGEREVFGGTHYDPCLEVRFFSLGLTSIE